MMHKRIFYYCYVNQYTFLVVGAVLSLLLPLFTSSIDVPGIPGRPLSPNKEGTTGANDN